jgi:hypothetical protein
VSSGQAWWSDHEESMEHIQGRCMCDATFRSACGMRQADPEAEQDDDKLTADERVLVERVCNTTDRLSPPVGQLVNIIDRLAPKPTPKETVEDVLRAMKLETPRCEMWANRIEAALKGGAR